MANLEILRTPSIEYSGMYFPEIAARLRQYARTYVPEITNEDRRSLVIQLERAFALMVHYNNVLLDMVANEMFLPTARLPESVKQLLALINYRVLPSSPASVDLLGKLSRTYTTTTRLLDANRKFATKRSVNESELVFENSSAVDTTYRTDQISDAYIIENDGDVGGCDTSSLYPDMIFWTSGDDWTTSDINNYIELSLSTLGNNSEDLRIIELLDETTPGSGIYRTLRLENASFITDTGIFWTKRTVSVNNAAALNAGIGAALFAASPIVGDKFIVGHADVMWDRFDFTLALGTANVVACWEFYDPDETSFQPDDVIVDPSPGILRFDLTSLLGIEVRIGALVKVTHVPTGTSSNNYSTFGSSINYVDIDGYLGQTIPSTSTGDYLVTCAWREVDTLADTTKPASLILANSGYMTFNIPQTQDNNWQPFSIYDKSVGEFREAYYLRYRVAYNPMAGAGPIPSRIVFTSGDQYALVPLTQGKTVADNPLGSSTGDASQYFTLQQTPYIYRSIRLFVDEGGGDIEWTEVETLLTSSASTRSFVVDVQTNGSAIIRFGDGINGRVPPVGVNNIRALYRIGADEDGNIGINTLTVNRDGAGVFKSVTNPRSGKFWVEADWNSEEALERVKLSGPQLLRTMYRAVTSKDIEILARAYKNNDGIKPITRAKAYEEAYGPKTVELVVSGTGGAALSSEYKQQIEEFFNGGTTYNGVLVTNHEVSVTNYTPRMIAYTMEITAYPVVTEALVIQALSALLSPTSIESDGVSYTWEFGQEVPNSRVISEIFSISPGNVFKVVISSPTVDVGLETKELPLFDVANTHIVIVAPNF